MSRRLVLLMGLAAAAQDPAAGSQPGPVGTQVQAAIRAWTGPRNGDPAARADAARTISAARRPGMLELAAVLRAARASGPGPVEQALLSLVPAVGIETLRRELATGYVFAGQYDELRELLPEVGTFFQQLVLTPPDWLATADVGLVLPVLRDLYPAPPDAALLARLRTLAADESPSPALHQGIACALAQWGMPEFAVRLQTQLNTRIAAANERDALLARAQLARLHYDLRDYARAADEQTKYLRAVEQGEAHALPLEHYNAACDLALAGRTEEALHHLGRAVELQFTVNTDQRVPYRLLEEDPDLATIRGTDAFRALLRRASAR